MYRNAGNCKNTQQKIKIKIFDLRELKWWTSQIDQNKWGQKQKQWHQISDKSKTAREVNKFIKDISMFIASWGQMSQNKPKVNQLPNPYRTEATKSGNQSKNNTLNR